MITNNNFFFWLPEFIASAPLHMVQFQEAKKTRKKNKVNVMPATTESNKIKEKRFLK